jgi:hypothetical protein
LTRADEALYVAKARGRNRIEIAGSYAGRGIGRRGSDMTTAEPQPQFGPGVLAASASPATSPAEEGADFRRPIIDPAVT